MCHSRCFVRLANIILILREDYLIDLREPRGSKDEASLFGVLFDNKS